MQAVCATVAALALVLSLGVQAQDKSGVLDRKLPAIAFAEQSLPDVTKRMSDAAGVLVKLAPEITDCIAKERRGCDWSITATWSEGATLASALSSLTGSTKLSYRVVDSNTVEITRKR